MPEKKKLLILKTSPKPGRFSVDTLYNFEEFCHLHCKVTYYAELCLLLASCWFLA
jgi:hypothetical protein